MAWRRIGASWAVPAAVALGLNSAYLALRSDPDPFYFANVALHPLLGLALAASVGPRVRRGFRALAGPERVAALLLGGATALGLVLLLTGATRPYRPILWVHIALAAAGAASSSAAPRPAPMPGFPSGRGAASSRSSRSRAERSRPRCAITRTSSSRTVAAS